MNHVHIMKEITSQYQHRTHESWTESYTYFSPNHESRITPYLLYHHHTDTLYKKKNNTPPLGISAYFVFFI